MELYTYFRSTAAYRIRIALNLKGLDATLIPVNLVKGSQRSDEYLKLNPQGLVPILRTDSGDVLNQSLAILEYLDETYPDTKLLPGDPLQKAKIRSFCYEIACEMHPLNNLRVLQYLEGSMKLSAEQKQTWYEHWVATGFKAIEQRLAELHTGSQAHFCFTESPTLADCLLIPQVFNARRFNCDMTPYPLINSIDQHCATITAFSNAAPSQQADAV